MRSPFTALEFRQKINTANIALTSGTEYSSALMDNGHSLKLSARSEMIRLENWRISFLKTKWPNYAVNTCICYAKQETHENNFFADKDNSI